MRLERSLNSKFPGYLLYPFYWSVSIAASSFAVPFAPVSNARPSNVVTDFGARAKKATFPHRKLDGRKRTAGPALIVLISQDVTAFLFLPIAGTYRDHLRSAEDSEQYIECIRTIDRRAGGDHSRNLSANGVNLNAEAGSKWRRTWIQSIECGASFLANLLMPPGASPAPRRVGC